MENDGSRAVCAGPAVTAGTPNVRAGMAIDMQPRKRGLHVSLNDRSLRSVLGVCEPLTSVSQLARSYDPAMRTQQGPR